jgi:hypothetical protein
MKKIKPLFELATEELKRSATIAKHNRPISIKHGDVRQAKLQGAVVKSCRGAIKALRQL